MTNAPQTEARATIAAYIRGEITLDEAERRAQVWYAAHVNKQPHPEKRD